MKRKQVFTQPIFYTLFFMMSVIFLLNGCAGGQDVAFARSVMNDLIAGRYAARHHIDWASFVVLEDNLSVDYMLMANDKEKKDYQCSFIDSFKTSFKAQGATQRSFTNWRMFNDADPQMSYVAADNVDGSATLIFYVAHEKGKRKLTGIRAIHVQDRPAYAEFEKEQRHVLQEGPPKAR
jgi:hypothetical protein